VESSDSQNEREVRAARNQALFRAVNRKLEEINREFEVMTETFTIACECADVGCLEMIDIRADEYEAVRAKPRHFVVAPGHIYPDVEKVVRESNGYAVVEKTGAAGEEAETLAEFEGA
jgi:5-bromo-4-chloroindolyl phosphate hydrolysis protein